MKTFFTVKPRFPHLVLVAGFVMSFAACRPAAGNVDLGFSMARIGSNALSVSSKLRSEAPRAEAAESSGKTGAPEKNVISAHN